jgi:hypothetical protein
MSVAFSTSRHVSKSSRELSRREVIEKYPEVSPFTILKIDVQRRSLIYTERAIASLDPARHAVQINHIFGYSADLEQKTHPVSLLLRDGTTLLAVPNPLCNNPYVVDYLDGRSVILDDGEVVDEVEYWPRHNFEGKFTSSGKPMEEIAAFSRPQRLDFQPYRYCHFWDHGQGCKYCNIGSAYQQAKKLRNFEVRVSPQDIYETTREAIKQQGRYVYIVLTGGSIPGPENTFDEEVQIYIDTLQAIGANFNGRRFPSQLIASAFPEKHLARLYEQTGLWSYTADLEVPNEEKFNWICPGKAASVGYREWRRRLIAAVDIFGRGRVNTCIVGGVALATPNGYVTEEEGLKATLDGSEELASQGVAVVACVWQPCVGSVFYNQKTPSLEFHVRLAHGLDNFRRQYKLNVDMDNYRRCGNHPDTDLSRI